MENQFGIMGTPKWLVGAFVTALYMVMSTAGEKVILAFSDVLVLILGAMLIGVTLYLIPHWNFDMVALHNPMPAFSQLVWGAVAGFGVFVFAFNFSAACTTFGAVYREDYGKEKAAKKASNVVLATTIVLFLIYMSFTFSSIFTFTPEQLTSAKEGNVTVFTTIANTFENPFISYLSPIIALLAVTTSFVGHFLGVQEASTWFATRLLNKEPNEKNKTNDIIVLVFSVVVFFYMLHGLVF